jgi:hypothetical protein
LATPNDIARLAARIRSVLAIVPPLARCIAANISSDDCPAACASMSNDAPSASALAPVAAKSMAADAPPTAAKAPPMAPSTGNNLPKEPVNPAAVGFILSSDVPTLLIVALALSLASSKILTRSSAMRCL